MNWDQFLLLSGLYGAKIGMAVSMAYAFLASSITGHLLYTGSGTRSRPLS